MPNHFHLVLQPSAPNALSPAQDYTIRYEGYTNRYTTTTTSLRPVHGLLLVQDRLPIRTDDAEADKIAGLDAEDIHPEDQRRRGRWERPVRSSAASNRFHIRLIIPESRIVEGHVFIRNVRVGLPERLLLASAAGALGPTRKGIDHLPAAPHGQVHMGKLGLP